MTRIIVAGHGPERLKGRPKTGPVKENFSPVKTSKGVHSINSIKQRWETYTATFDDDDNIATISVYYKNKKIAHLTRLSDSFFKKYTIDFAELEDLDGIYLFLKVRKIKYRRL